MDVAVYLFSWCPAGAKTSEEGLLPVLIIDAKTTSDYLEMKPKSCSLQENKRSLWNTADEDVSSRGHTEWTNFADIRIVFSSAPSMKRSLLHKTGNVVKKQSPEP